MDLIYILQAQKSSRSLVPRIFSEKPWCTFCQCHFRHQPCMVPDSCWKKTSVHYMPVFNIWKQMVLMMLYEAGPIIEASRHEINTFPHTKMNIISIVSASSTLRDVSNVYESWYYFYPWARPFCDHLGHVFLWNCSRIFFQNVALTFSSALSEQLIKMSITFSEEQKQECDNHLTKVRTSALILFA